MVKYYDLVVWEGEWMETNNIERVEQGQVRRFVVVNGYGWTVVSFAHKHNALSVYTANG